MRKIQGLLGRSGVGTEMLYTHVLNKEAGEDRSPLDLGFGKYPFDPEPER